MANTTPKKRNDSSVTRTFLYLSVMAAVMLFVIGGLAMWASTFTGNMVRSELAAQKIYFPAAGSAALDPTEFPDLQKYAGQLVDSPEKAQAYANGFIGRHLEKVADGKVYSEVSALAAKDPTNATLAKQKQTLFQGETLRGILLTSGYGFGTLGKIAGAISLVAFIGGAALLLAAAVLRTRL